MTNIDQLIALQNGDDIHSQTLVRYDIQKDEYIPVTQQWVTEVQRKIIEQREKIIKLIAEKEMLEAMLKGAKNEK